LTRKRKHGARPSSTRSWPGQGIKGTGSNSARSFLGFGSATNDPQKGDIVVLRSGAAPSGAHVGFFAGQQNGRVLVTGGNQGGGRVTTSSFAQSSVLGFRRAPSAADAFSEEEKLADKAKRDLEQLTQFGEQAASQIGQLANRALNTGTLQQANAQLAQLDKTWPKSRSASRRISKSCGPTQRQPGRHSGRHYEAVQ
jgi:hypothetical protein